MRRKRSDKDRIFFLARYVNLHIASKVDTVAKVSVVASSAMPLSGPGILESISEARQTKVWSEDDTLSWSIIQKSGTTQNLSKGLFCIRPFQISSLQVCG